MPSENTTTAPPLGAFTVRDGEVVRADPPAGELTLAERLDQMNGAPPSPDGYVLPDIRTAAGEVWQPTPEQSAAIDGFRGLAHRYSVTATDFADIAEHAGRGNLVNMEPNVLAAHLVNELGEAKAAECGALMYRIMMEDPEAFAFLHQYRNPRVYLALYRAVSRRK
jgi:hypothetical protein